MKLAIFTLVEHIKRDGKLHGYAPYIREMDIWNAHFKEVIVVAPLSKKSKIDIIEVPYSHAKIKHVEVPVFNIKSIGNILKLLIQLPVICYKMAIVMRQSDHLHFRCPSNISAIASIIQIFFPKKKKTMRYAGNWDPNSKQPIGYRFQKWIFSNSFLTQNMKALVYGDWENKASNIQPFFAATFSEDDKIEFKNRDYSSRLKFVFLGALVSGKRPLMAVQILQRLQEKGVDCSLDIFGDGPLKLDLEDYVNENSISDSVIIHGNKTIETIKRYLNNAHFIILPSKSEGWPKAIAEGMFFGCIPISTRISCVPWMLDNGERGILIQPELDEAVEEILYSLRNKDLNAMSQASQAWSQVYTLEKQTEEIDKILKP